MKTKYTRLSLLILLFLSFYRVQAQVPQGINYQSVVRDSNGNPRPNYSATIVVGLVNSASDTFTESHSVTTNQYGVVSLVIGSIDVVGFAAFDWTQIPTTIGLVIDGVNAGTQPLQSVPYALHSALADSVVGLGASPWQENGTDIYNNTENVGIGISAPKTILHVGENINSPLGDSPDRTILLSADGDDAYFNSSTNDMSSGLLMLDGGAESGLVHNSFSNGYFLGKDKGLHIYTKEAEPILFSTTDVTRVVIDGVGNVGVGNNTPSEKLDVAGDVKVSTDVLVGNDVIVGQNVELNGEVIRSGYPMLPNAYGFVEEGGASKGVGYTDIQKINTGVYDIKLPIAVSNIEDVMIQVTPVADGGVPVITNYNLESGQIRVYLMNPSGDAIDRSFSFTIYRP